MYYSILLGGRLGHSFLFLQIVMAPYPKVLDLLLPIGFELCRVPVHTYRFQKANLPYAILAPDPWFSTQQNSKWNPITSTNTGTSFRNSKLNMMLTHCPLRRPKFIRPRECACCDNSIEVLWQKAANVGFSLVAISNPEDSQELRHLFLIANNQLNFVYSFFFFFFGLHPLKLKKTLIF